MKWRLRRRPLRGVGGSSRAGLRRARPGRRAVDRAEATLLSHPAFARLLLQQFPNGSVSVLDADLRYLLVDGSDSADMRRLRVTLPGRTVFEQFPPDVLDHVVPFFRRALAGETLQFDFAFAERRYVVTVAPLPDRFGRVDAIVAIAHDVTARLLAEQQRDQLLVRLEQERDRLAAIVEQLPVGLIVAEAPSGRLLLGNRQVEAIWRHPFLAAASIGEYDGYRGFFPDRRPYRPQDWPLARALTSGEVVRAEEIDVLRGDGTSGTIEVSAVPIRDRDGQISAAVAMFVDITQRKRAGQIAARLESLQAITAALSEALTPEQVAAVVVERGVAVLGASAGALALLTQDGAALEIIQAVGYPQSSLDAFQRIPLNAALPYADALRRGAPIWIESEQERDALYPALAGYRPSGAQAWAVLPLPVDRRVLGALGLSFSAAGPFSADAQAFMRSLAHQCAQALERSRLYDAERRARQRLAFLAEASSVLASSLAYQETLASVARLVVPQLADYATVHLRNDDGVIELVEVAHIDPAGAELIRAMDRRIGAESGGSGVWADLIARGETVFFPAVPAELLEAMAIDAEYRRMLDTLAPRSGILAPMYVRGRVIGSLVLTMAESGRRYTPDDVALAEELARRAAQAIDNARLYQDAQRAVSVRDQFLSIAAHELKTPLTSLLGNAQLLERRASQDGGLAPRDLRAARVVAEQAGRLNKMIKALLDVSRIERGSLSIERVPVDLVALTLRVVDELQPTLVQHTLTCEPPDLPLVVAGDDLRLEQVLQNLIGNAIKYSPSGGPVLVQLLREGGQACVRVSDRGLGIAPPDLPNLFQRFYRGSNVDARYLSGMGIGLFVVKEIVGLHGGTVEVSSEEGRGSTFTICLPLAHLAP